MSLVMLGARETRTQRRASESILSHLTFQVSSALKHRSHCTRFALRLVYTYRPLAPPFFRVISDALATRTLSVTSTRCTPHVLGTVRHHDGSGRE
eukprot:31303-Pelagococcus_subviridis.AAC.36